MKKIKTKNFLKAKSPDKVEDSRRSRNYKLKACDGFTLLESLVAIAVFTVGVSSSIFVINQAINVGARTKYKITAAYLAQEGIEVIRSIRDRNWKAGNIYNVSGTTCFNDGNCWTRYVNDSDGMSNFIKSGCVQYDSDFLDDSCVLGSYLRFDGNNYVSDLDSSASQFERTVTTTWEPPQAGPLEEPERLLVQSTVTCGLNCSVSLEEYLYNWK